MLSIETKELKINDKLKEKLRLLEDLLILLQL